MNIKPLSDAERQRRRQKLKAKAEDTKFAPESFMAEALCDLALSGEIPETQITRICEEAFKIAIKQHPEFSVILQKYVEKKINDFFKPEEK